MGTKLTRQRRLPMYKPYPICEYEGRMGSFLIGICRESPEEVTKTLCGRYKVYDISNARGDINDLLGRINVPSYLLINEFDIDSMGPSPNRSILSDFFDESEEFRFCKEVGIDYEYLNLLKVAFGLNESLERYFPKRLKQISIREYERRGLLKFAKKRK